jgi:hypothetical protein
MSIGKYILSFIIGIFFITSIVAQQVWPVQVTGSLVPPHSLNLGVYGAERTQDLTFSAMLKDPVQASLQVRLSLSIEQNGTIIYQTDPNYVGMPITLNQFQNMVLDGNVLRSYLNSQALTGVNGTGMGSIEIPEGFNQICLQIYGLERNVPISNKFCMSGNFRLNQPPQIVKPACGEKIKLPLTQNMIFNWQPMHLGSPNSPGAVEYEFELVQLPEGTFNANDVFDSALKIFRTKSFSASLLYTQAEPNLAPNKVYAWRVRATSVMNPTSRLFQNDGLSQICTFMLYEGDKPDDDINPSNRPSPRGCSVYETSYGPVAITNNDPMIVAPNQDVKVGYFDMKIVDASGNHHQGYSGKGLIVFPMLRSTLEVVYKNIKVNKEGRVYEAELIEAKNEKFPLTSEQLMPDQIAKNLGNDYAVNLYKYMGKTRQVSMMSNNGEKINVLPLSLVNEKQPSSSVSVIGVRWTPTNAYLNLIGLEKDGNVKNSQLTISDLSVSAGTAIPATPYGVKNKAHLVPIIGSENARETSVLNSLLVAYSQNGDSKLYCDCEGVFEKKVNKTYVINPALVVTASDKLPLTLALKDKKQPFESYNGLIESVEDFKIVGIDNITFSASGGVLQLNDVQNPSFPADVKSLITKGTSKGILLQGMKALLPAKYNLAGKNDLVLDQGHLFIDSETVQLANISKKNIIALKDGKSDKWQYSVDEMSVEINNGTFEGPKIKGQIKLPVASNLIPYSGRFDINTNDLPSLLIDEKPTTLDIAMWHSKMVIQSESNIAVDIKNINSQYTFLPKSNLTGQLNMQMDGTSFLKSIKGNVAEISTNLESVFKVGGDIKSIRLEGINIQNWNVDPYNPIEKKYNTGNIDITNSFFIINDKKYPLTNAAIKFEMIDGKESIGLFFTSINGNSKMEMSVWATDKNGQFVFDHIAQIKYILNCDCVEGKAFGYTNKLKNNLGGEIGQNEVSSQYNGSLASSNDGSKKENYYSFVTNNISENTDDDFILKDDKTLYWPLIDRDLPIEKTGKRIKMKDRILVDQNLFSKLGFKTQLNIPLGSSLYVATVDIDEWKERGAIANITFVLESSYDTKNEEKRIVFRSGKVNATGTAVKLENVDLYAENPVKNEDWKFENYHWSTRNNNATESNRNLARIDCTSGFTYYQMFGEIILDDMVNKSDKSLAKIPFRLNTSTLGNSHSLVEFIAICQDFASDKKDSKWNIHPKDLPQVSFKAGENYAIYFDNSSNKKIPGSLASVSYNKSTSDKAFKGIIIENASCELLGFYDAKKAPLSLPITDLVYVFNDFEKGLHSSFELKDVIDKKDGAKISGWKYSLDSVSYAIKNSVYKSNLEIKGEISIPIFKQNPDKIKSVKFDSSWVEFTGTVYVSSSNGESKVSSLFEFDDVSYKTYQSDFIPGLGVVLNDDSNISLLFNNQTNNWDPSGTFSGIGIVLLTTETMKAYGLKNFPDGMDLSLHCLTFEGLELNKKTASASAKLIDEYGIKSIEFGTWGVVDIKSIFNNEDKDDEDKEEVTEENKDTANDVTPEVSTASGKIVRKKGEVKVVSEASGSIKTTELTPEVSTASGKIVRSKGGVKVVSTASGSVKRTKKTNTSTPESAAITAKADTEPEFNSLKFDVDCKGIKAVGDNFELGISVTLSLLGDNKEKKGEKEEVKTCAINAKGGVGLAFSRNKDGRFVPDGVNFKCLALDGSIGPVAFNGGLNILRTPKDENGKAIVTNNHGSGFKAYLSATVMGLGGIQAVGQFGKKTMSETDAFYYGFIDLEAFKQSGFPIPPPTPSNPPIIDLYGGGGGIRINMRSANSISDLKIKPDTNTPPADDCPIPDAKYLAPGVGFSQNYEPEKGTYGGNFYVILGPWNELDNQNPPIYSIIAEPGIDMEISTDKATGDLQFRKISVNVNAYFKPTSLAKRRDENIADAYAKIELNLADRVLVGGFGMRMKVDAVGLESPLLQIPEDYSTTDFNTKANYVGGKLVFSFDNGEEKKPFFNFKFGGSSIGNYTSASELKYNTALLNLNDIIKVKAGAYFQIGNDVDNFPPIKELIPQISDMESAKYDEVKSDENSTEETTSGAGISFGFKGSIEGKTETGPLVGNFDVGLGFNILLKEMKQVSCSNTENGSIGIKGWYAQGQAFGYANCNVNLAYNLIFTSGRVNIMKAGAFIYLNAKAPNPSYFSGRVNGNYSVLDGLLEGSFNCKVQLGEKCENLEAPSPLDGINIFNEANIVDGQTNVDRYTDIILATNIALQKEFHVPQTDADGNILSTASFIADVKELKLTYSKKQKIGSFGTVKKEVIQNHIQKIHTDKKGINLTFDNPLQPNTEYQLAYSFIWKKSEIVNGKVEYIENFESGKKGDTSKQPLIEKGIIKFKTGERPTKIMSGMVEYMAPGVGQRYWHSGYANTEIKFKLKALEDAVHLFPDTCQACTDAFGSTVKFKYSVQLKEYGLDGKKVSEQELPITTYPKKAEMAKILKAKSLSVNNGQYQINVLSEEMSPISQVSFPDLKGLQLTKGAMYELVVLQEPDLKNISTNKTAETSLDTSTVLTVNKGKNSDIAQDKINKVIKDNTVILHSSFFAVSNYDSLQGKMNLLEVKHVKSKVKRRDFQHPNDAFDGQRAAAISKYGESKFHSVKDDYYAFTIKNDNLEGFDNFDIMRLKRNIQLSYNDTYLPEQRIKYDRYGGKGIYNKFDELLSGFKDIGGYMRKVLYEYSKAESEGIAKYGNLSSSDGSKWHYNITGPKDEKCALLQSDEIAAKKVIHKIGYKSKSDPNFSDPVFEKEIEFDFLLQDYRSRIIINQMAWLSRLSNTYTNSKDLNNWLPGNYPEGEFLSENKRFNNFDWVLYGDSNKNDKGNKFSYVASEPGYQFSYHGGSKISFPSDKNWNEMIESKRDQTTSLVGVKEFSPNRETSNITEQTITNATELVENYWYKFKVNGEYLKIGDKNQAWSSLWSVCYPYSDFTYNTGQYGIYSLGGGGMPTIREFRSVTDPMSKFENVWNFVSVGGNAMKVVNERYKNGDETDDNRYFPKVFDHRHFKDDNDKRFPSSTLPTQIEVVELSGLYFSPEKYYHIENKGAFIKDVMGSDKWRIIQESNFYRFQSSNGYILKIDYYEEYKFFGSNVDHYNVKTDDKKFPADKYGDRNGYYRSVWAVVPESAGSQYYFIKNIRYPEYFLALDNGKIIAKKTSYGDQIKIIESKN